LDKMKSKINSRGGERVLSIYWFLIFLVVAIAVVSGVYIFFSKPIDVREAEAGILNDKLINCFIENGKLKNFEISGFDLEDKCGLDLNDRSTGYDGSKNYENNQYYLEIDIGVLGKEKVIAYGDASYKPFCGQEASRKNIPYCYINKMVVIDSA